MVHAAKNTTHNHTYQFKNERERLVKFYNSTPFYGNPLSEKFYTSIKKAIPSLIQASICGANVSLVTYQKDADKAAHLLSEAFKKPVKRIECTYTKFVTVYLINL